MNNSTRSRSFCQLTPEIILQHTSLLNKSKLRLYNIIISYRLRYGTVCPSVATLAQLTGVCERTVYRYFKDFIKLGLLRVTPRMRPMGRKMDTSLYFVPDELFGSEAIQKLKQYLPILESITVGIKKLFINSSLLLSVFCQGIHGSLYLNKTQHNLEVTLTKRIEPLRLKNPKNAEKVCDVKNKKGEMKIVEIYSSEPPTVEEMLPAAVQEIKSVKLTLAGKVWLSAFPAESLRKADSVLLKTPGINDPFRFLFKIALTDCRERGLMPNWQNRSILAGRLHVSDNSVFVETTQKTEANVPRRLVPTSRPLSRSDSSLSESRHNYDHAAQLPSEKPILETKEFHVAELAKNRQRLADLDPRSFLADETRQRYSNMIAYHEKELETFGNL